MQETQSRPPAASRNPLILSKACVLGVLLLIASAVSVGCGTNAEQLALQLASATGRTWLDQALTDFVNDIDQAEGDDQTNDDDEPDNDGDDDDTVDGDDNDTPQPDDDDGAPADDDGAPIDDGDGGQTGDPAAGEVLFAACGGCHCADGSGGCAADAPSLIGIGAAVMDDAIRGDAPHLGGKSDLSDQDIADLVAFLASLK